MIETIGKTSNAVSTTEIGQKFEALKQHAPEMGRTSAAYRIKLLKKLLQAMLRYRNEITQALKDDYNRSPVETELADTWVVVKELKFAIRHLDQWLKPRHVPTPLPFVGTSSYIHHEAKGVVLIISPWNFPFNLSFAPLVSAIAGGNTVLIKPSEYTPKSAKLITRIVAETFPNNVVDVANGGVEAADELLKLPFNHIFFTGSPRVGKIVMKAAAEHLASVTLELGGKSPTIIDESVDIKSTAKHVVYSKFSNKGQVCIATDYVYVHESIASEFLKAAKSAINEIFPRNKDGKDDYPRIVNTRQTARLRVMVDDAINKGATAETALKIDEDERYIAPLMLSGISDDMQIAQEEIFGPLLPIKTFTSVEELAARINAGSKPLAMHIFTRKKARADYLIAHTQAGAVLVNETFIHHFNSYLPFGGVNNSGLGKSHGYHGFLEFVNPKAVVRHWLPWRPSSLLHPPYTKFTRFLVDVLLKYF